MIFQCGSNSTQLTGGSNGNIVCGCAFSEAVYFASSITEAIINNGGPYTVIPGTTISLPEGTFRGVFSARVKNLSLVISQLADIRAYLDFGGPAQDEIGQALQSAYLDYEESLALETKIFDVPAGGADVVITGESINSPGNNIAMYNRSFVIFKVTNSL